MDESTITTIRNKYKGIRVFCDERSRRVWAAAKTESLGRGGISTVSYATDIGHRSIHKGIQELYRSR
jgi:hypothetical protein